MLGKVEGERRGRQRVRWLDDIINSRDMSLNKLRKMVMNREAFVLQSVGLQRVGHDQQLNNRLNWAEHGLLYYP